MITETTSLGNIKIKIDMTKTKCDDCGKEFPTRRMYLNHLKQYGYSTMYNGRKVRIRGTKG